MTPYAESLIEYCMWYGKRSREDAIKLLDDSAHHSGGYRASHHGLMKLKQSKTRTRISDKMDS